MSDSVNHKKAYQRPVLSRIGSIGEVTLANQGGTVLDIPFEAGTPIDQLTTS